MKKSKMIMTVIVSFCIVILFIPMGVANANNKETASTYMGRSIAGSLLTAGVNNISDEVVAMTAPSDENSDSTPDTRDRAPICIVSTLAILSLGIMTTICVREYFV
ncbi:MAG: hypothetical protein K6G26_07215 [Lachnospiraceae bacterium]|nr:hypothetical protein [Lachnospiraceae bacterium]